MELAGSSCRPLRQPVAGHLPLTCLPSVAESRGREKGEPIERVITGLRTDVAGAGPVQRLYSLGNAGLAAPRPLTATAAANGPAPALATCPRTLRDRRGERPDYRPEGNGLPCAA